jgi:hypothetical protein
VKVFISSVIRGYGAYRDAAEAGSRALGHDVIRAEDFGASPESPQAACLAGVRDADVVVLLLGEKYGYPQEAGLSATHEEYREARASRPVIVFTEAGVAHDPQQAEVLLEVQRWEHGHYTEPFTDAGDLRDKVTRALHNYQLATEAAPLDEGELLERARSLAPAARNSGGANLSVIVAGGPRRAVLRPAELESESLRRSLLAAALTGPDAVLSTAHGTQSVVRGDTLQLTQEGATGAVALDESGSVVVMQPAFDRELSRAGLSSIIEEDITDRITRALRFVGHVLDEIDGAQRLTHLAVLVSLQGGGHMPWKTRAEQLRTPGEGTISMRASEESIVALTPPVRRRAVLLHDTASLAEDFTVRLRREVRG